jgi:membrane glycosyltransferase
MMKLGPIEKLTLFALIIYIIQLSYVNYKMNLNVTNNITSSIIDAVLLVVFLVGFLKMTHTSAVDGFVIVIFGFLINLGWVLKDNLGNMRW